MALVAGARVAGRTRGVAAATRVVVVCVVDVLGVAAGLSAVAGGGVLAAMVVLVVVAAAPVSVVVRAPAPGAPGVSWATPRSCGCEAYQPAAARPPSTITPAAIATPGTPLSLRRT